MPLDVLYSDFLGNVEGSTRGIGAGIVHIAWPALGILGQSGTLGGSFTLAVGAALSSRIREEKQVTLCFFGDGTSNRGTFHEAANAAGVWKLPIVWLCENNGLAVSTTIQESCAVSSIAQRAAGYGMPGVVVDGQDPVAVYEAARTAIERARDGGGPTLIEAMTCRFRGHYEGDSQEYRDRVELEKLRKERDPLDVVIARIRAVAAHADAQLNEIRARVTEEVAAAAAKARGGTAPQKSRVFEYVYA
jgi:acetoin:2,6-dichlorophenolindophenol oxidoreductase subunit alpha